MPSPDLYAVLGLEKGSTTSSVQVRRAFRTLSTKLHPDKGGSAEAFKTLSLAHSILSDPMKRKRYDSDGSVVKTADEEFLDGFSQGTFQDPIVLSMASSSLTKSDGSLAEQIIMHQGEAGKPGSHTAGFEAWMRSRGLSAEGCGGAVFDAQAAASQFGVVKESYHPVLLQPEDVVEVVCSGPGKPVETLTVNRHPLPPALEWGQVLVKLAFSPINPADIYSARLGGVYGSEAVSAPYAAGHDGVGLVEKVGPGTKELHAGDIVLPLHTFMGTWQSKAVWMERDLMRIPQDIGLSLEYLAMSRELCTAYSLLERSNLKPGDCVILNSANSTVGQVLLQLARILKLRTIAVARDPSPSSIKKPQATTGMAYCEDRPVIHADGSSLGNNDGSQSDANCAASNLDACSQSWDRMVAYLKAIGATHVLKDEGSFKIELDKLKFFARPKLALDAVGGESGVRLAEALAEGGEMVMYGAMSGKAPSLPWQAFVFKGIKVSGFNFRQWLVSGPPAKGASLATISTSPSAATAAARITPMLKAIGKLVSSNLLILNHTEYDLSSEFSEALDHALDRGKNTKVLVCSSPSSIRAP